MLAVHYDIDEGLSGTCVVDHLRVCVKGVRKVEEMGGPEGGSIGRQ